MLLTLQKTAVHAHQRCTSNIELIVFFLLQKQDLLLSFMSVRDPSVLSHVSPSTSIALSFPFFSPQRVFFFSFFPTWSSRTPSLWTYSFYKNCQPFLSRKQCLTKRADGWYFVRDPERMSEEEGEGRRERESRRRSDPIFIENSYILFIIDFLN